MKILSNIIKNSKRILITSHSRPDQDAIASTYFLKKILQKNFPNKEYFATIDSSNIKQFDKLFDINEIESTDILSAINSYHPDLIFITDLSDLNLLNYNFDLSKFKSLTNKTKIVIIDHHNTKIKYDFVNLLINKNSNSCTEILYDIFIKRLKLNPYKEFYNHLLFGIIADTGSFSYLKSNPKLTFKVASELVSLGGNIDYIKTISERLTSKQLLVEKEFLANLVSTNEYTYSFISDDFFIENKEILASDYSTANKHFVQIYLKTINNAMWGFAIKPSEKGTYSISFRSPTGFIDLTVFAKHFNGGGHKAAAGGELQANSIGEALKKVFIVIDKHIKEAFENK